MTVKELRDMIAGLPDNAPVLGFDDKVSEFGDTEPKAFYPLHVVIENDAWTVPDLDDDKGQMDKAIEALVIDMRSMVP